MIKKDLITLISNETHYSRYTVTEIVESMLDNITKCLARGDKVRISGFGTFEPKKRAPRLGRNPHTGEEVPIPARTIPAFKSEKLFRDAVSKNNN